MTLANCNSWLLRYGTIPLPHPSLLHTNVHSLKYRDVRSLVNRRSPYEKRRKNANTHAHTCGTSCCWARNDSTSSCFGFVDHTLTIFLYWTISANPCSGYMRKMQCPLGSHEANAQVESIISHFDKFHHSNPLPLCVQRWASNYTEHDPPSFSGEPNYRRCCYDKAKDPSRTQVTRLLLIPNQLL